MEEDHTCGKGIVSFLKIHYQGLIVIIPPILFLPVMVMSEDVANRCMYLLMVMAVYWITEVVPLGITSMLPILAFPLMNILDCEKTCTLYFKDTLVMFVTSIMVACSIEYSNLHIRIALKIIKLVGCSPRRLHFGICTVTSLLSMWIANSACTAMMLPIIYAVLDQLSEQGLIKQYHEEDANLPKTERRPSKVAACFYLSVAYGASIGGIGSLIGTPTNLAFKGIYDTYFPNSVEKLEFGIFLVYAVPSAIISALFMFLGMELIFMGLFRPKSKDAQDIEVGEEGAKIGKKVIDDKYAELGPLSTHEKSVAIIFALLIFLYISRKPGFTKGWNALFKCSSIKNSVPTIVILFVLFSLPTNYHFLKVGKEQSLEPTQTLLTWEFILAKVPWGLIFLVGGGAVLSEGSRVSGMASKLGTYLHALSDVPSALLILLFVIGAVILTNFSANVAMCNIIIPVVAEMAIQIRVHPLKLVLPAGLACSMAFVLPVGTPPNAMVQAYGNIPQRYMCQGGGMVSLTTVIILWLSALTWGVVVFPNTSDYPSWADEKHEEKSSNILWIWEDV